MERGIDSKFNFFQFFKFTRLYPHMLGQELLIQILNSFNLFLVHYVKYLVLDVNKFYIVSCLDFRLFNIIFLILVFPLIDIRIFFIEVFTQLLSNLVKLRQYRRFFTVLFDGKCTFFFYLQQVQFRSLWSFFF